MQAMNPMSTEEIAALFKALSEPVRIRLMFLLLEGGEELCVCDLVETLGLTQSVVSRHLAYLRNHGLVTTRREGVWIYYRVVEGCCSALFEHIRECGANCLEMQTDLVRLSLSNRLRKCG